MFYLTMVSQYIVVVTRRHLTLCFDFFLGLVIGFIGHLKKCGHPRNQKGPRTTVVIIAGKPLHYMCTLKRLWKDKIHRSVELTVET